MLTDERHAVEKREELHYEGGIEAFVKYLDRNKTPLVPTADHRSRPSATAIGVECALWWNDGYHENMLCFTNNIPQRDGGTHLAGFRGALTRQVTGYAEKSRACSSKEKVELTGDDCREGLTARALGEGAGPEVLLADQGQAGLVRGAARRRERRQRRAQRMARGASERSARSIVGKVIEAAAAREAARKARELTRARARSTSTSLPGKLADCQERDPAKASCSSSRATRAGGSAKQGRDRAFQAVLPLRGKILNVERARFDKMLSSEQIGTLITALGTGIGTEEFNVDKLRYHKIIIMTDADVDGAHIRTLLLTFFYRQMRELIDRGYLYIAQPPLYKVTRGKSEQYLKNEHALEDYLIDTGIEDAVFRPHSGDERAPARTSRRSSRRRAASATCSPGCTAATTARWSSRRRSPAC